MENSQHQLQITSDKKEIKEHGSYAFPVRVSYESLSMYNGAFLWHWHPEIELTLVLEEKSHTESMRKDIVCRRETDFSLTAMLCIPVRASGERTAVICPSLFFPGFCMEKNQV